jgi:hypothetical protein
MHLRARRGIEALAILLVLLLGVSALIPLTARAAGNITGVVSTCGGPLPFVSGATVTLIDVNGIVPPATATTNGAGVYAFNQPPPATYMIAGNQSNYYPGENRTNVRFDGTQTKPIDMCLFPHITPPKVLTVTVQAGGSNVPGATVAAFQSTNPTGRIQLVAQGTTGTTGVVNLTLWSAIFQLRASALTFQTVEQSVNVSTVSAVTIPLGGTVELFGQVKSASGAFLSSGVVAWLYNPFTAANTSISRLIPGTVSASLYQFETARVPNAQYYLIVDADGYLSWREILTLMGAALPRHDVTLQPAPQERYDTNVTYGASDWNNVTLRRNITLNTASTLPGLGPANLRDLRLQIDSTLGNGAGVLPLPAWEITAFQNWLVAKGPAYVTTDGFFTTNGRSYNSTLSSFSMTMSNTLAISNARVWINTTAQYKLKGAPPYIATGAKTYFINMTMVPDSNTSVYKNYTYTVVLPRKYELNMTTLVPASAPVTTQNFTRITVDPGVTTGTPQIRMTASQSLTGSARGKVVAPPGKFYVLNATFSNYQAYVANNTVLRFSANDSTDPNGHAADANYTWRFTPKPGLADVRYGLVPAFKYVQNGTYTVNLTMRKVGGNVSFRNITIIVDDQTPVARFRTNRTGPGNVNGLTLKVDQGTQVRLYGDLSTDLAYPGKNGVILDPGYAWDFSGEKATGRTVDWTFRKAGWIYVNLTVTDSVGWKSANATLKTQVNDTTAPVPQFEILDPSKDWAVIVSPIEQRTIALNASKSTDDRDKLSKLNFTWTIPGPITGYQGIGNHTLWGVNVSFAWKEWNNSYAVLLTVRDTGFRGNDPPKPNFGNLTRKILVQIDVLLHANLRLDAGTMKVIPADPEEGAPVSVSVNVTNTGKAIASGVTTELRCVGGNCPAFLLASQADWFDKNGTSRGSDHTIPSGVTVKLVFSVRLTGQGNKTLQAYVYDKSEPYTWITSENRAQSPVNVRQPWWQPYAIGAAVIGVIVLFVFGMYARRKIKAGEWRPIRGRRGGGEKGGEEERKPRREVKEEKKRL